MQNDKAIPAIPIDAIQQFLKWPLIFERDEMEDWPYVVSSYEGHLIASVNNTIYVMRDRYGIRPTVKGEWWHFQPRNAYNWFPEKSSTSAFKTKLEELSEKPPEPEVNWAGIQAIIDDMGRQIAVSPLRRGSKGDVVKVVQSKLNSLDFNCGIADGVYGRKTLKAVLMLQRTMLIKESGTMDHKTWTAMWNPEIPIGL